MSVLFICRNYVCKLYVILIKRKFDCPTLRRLVSVLLIYRNYVCTCTCVCTYVCFKGKIGSLFVCVYVHVCVCVFYGGK